MFKKEKYFKIRNKEKNKYKENKENKNLKKHMKIKIKK